MATGKQLLCVGTYHPYADIYNRWTWEIVPYDPTFTPSNDTNVVELIATEHIEPLGKNCSRRTLYIGDQAVVETIGAPYNDGQ